MSYDLMLQTHPDREITADDFDRIQQDIGRNAALGRLCEVTPGGLAASNVDVLVLREGLDFGYLASVTSQRSVPVAGCPLTASMRVRHRLLFAVALDS